MIAHIMGIPIEETVLPLMPAGLAIITAITIATRTRARRLRQRLGHRSAEEISKGPRQ
jgi:hypothetical protein